MNICDENGHGEIAHEGNKCPACERVEELEKYMDRLDQRIEDLEEEVLELRSKTN